VYASRMRARRMIVKLVASTAEQTLWRIRVRHERCRAQWMFALACRPTVQPDLPSVA
jgi:hypothetical protein